MKSPATTPDAASPSSENRNLAAELHQSTLDTDTAASRDGASSYSIDRDNARSDVQSTATQDSIGSSDNGPQALTNASDLAHGDDAHEDAQAIFTLFPKLPADIRVKIYHHAILAIGPRRVAAHCNLQINEVPGIFGASFELREEALKQYTRLVFTAPVDNGFEYYAVLFHMELDTLIISHPSPWTGKLPFKYQIMEFMMPHGWESSRDARRSKIWRLNEEALQGIQKLRFSSRSIGPFQQHIASRLDRPLNRGFQLIPHARMTCIKGFYLRMPALQECGEEETNRKRVTWSRDLGTVRPWDTFIDPFLLRIAASFSA